LEEALNESFDREEKTIIEVVKERPKAVAGVK
jgi:hypothetical protein